MSEETNNVETQDTTTVGQVDVDIDAIFGASPDASNVMLPTETEEEKETEKPTNILATEKPFDTEFIDNPASTDEKTEDQNVAEQTEEAIAELDDLIKEEENAENRGKT